jgi:hypothetical protein
METVASETVPPTAQIAYNFTQEQMKDIWKHMNDNCNNKLFNTLPKKIRYPKYYEVVKKPITLEQISNNIKAGNYNHSEDFVTDMKLISSNCIKYYSKWKNKYGTAAMEFEKLLEHKLLEYVEENESVEDSDNAGSNDGNDGNGEQNDNTGANDGSDDDEMSYASQDAGAGAGAEQSDAENNDEEENEQNNDDVEKKGIR